MMTFNNMDADFTIREGTTLPVIRATLKHDDGQTVDFSGGYNQVLLKMARGVGQPPEMELEASVIEGNEALPDDTEDPNVQYVWQAEDTDPLLTKRGFYRCYWWVEWPDGSTSSFPSDERGFTIEITPE